jgi:hypothetical protein
MDVDEFTAFVETRPKGEHRGLIDSLTTRTPVYRVQPLRGQPAACTALGRTSRPRVPLAMAAIWCELQPFERLEQEARESAPKNPPSCFWLPVSFEG